MRVVERKETPQERYTKMVKEDTSERRFVCFNCTSVTMLTYQDIDENYRSVYGENFKNLHDWMLENPPYRCPVCGNGLLDMVPEKKNVKRPWIFWK